MYKTDWSTPAVTNNLDRLLMNRIEAHGRVARAVPRSRDWEAATAYLEEVERLLRSLKTRPIAFATA